MKFSKIDYETSDYLLEWSYGSDTDGKKDYSADGGEVKATFFEGG